MSECMTPPIHSLLYTFNYFILFYGPFDRKLHIEPCAVYFRDVYSAKPRQHPFIDVKIFDQFFVDVTQGGVVHKDTAHTSRNLDDALSHPCFLHFENILSAQGFLEWNKAHHNRHIFFVVKGSAAQKQLHDSLPQEYHSKHRIYQWVEHQSEDDLTFTPPWEALMTAIVGCIASPLETASGILIPTHSHIGLLWENDHNPYAELPSHLELTPQAFQYDLPQPPSHHKNSFVLLKLNLSGKKLTLSFAEKESNRILENEDSSRFMLVQFDMFKNRGKKADLLEKFVKQGIWLDQHSHYNYCGYSNSQFRNGQCYFYRGTFQEIEAMHFKYIVKESLPKTVAKSAARIGLLYSSCDLLGDQFEYLLTKDVTRGGHVFTDGCGEAGKNIFLACQKRYDLDYVPSVVQIRFEGCKGVLMLNPTLPPNLVLIRESMKKVDFSVTSLKVIESSSGVSSSQLAHSFRSFLGICDFARPKRLGVLNGQIIMLLSALGVEDKYFLQLSEHYHQFLSALNVHELDDSSFESLLAFGEVNICKMLVESSAQTTNKSKSNQGTRANTRSPSMQTVASKILQQYAQSQITKNISSPLAHDPTRERIKLRLPIVRSRTVFGVVDTSLSTSDYVPQPGTLEPNQIFLRVTINRSPRTIVGPVVVSKNPCYWPGDVQVFEAVDLNKPWLVDCVVFSTRGSVPAATTLAGSDYDGDQFFCCWDENFLPKSSQDPYSYPESKDPSKRGKFTHLDHIHYFCTAPRGLEGKIDSLFKKWAAKQGVNSPQCKLLGTKLFSEAVDAPKSGKYPKIPSEILSIDENKAGDGTREEVFTKLERLCEEFVAEQRKPHAQHPSCSLALLTPAFVKTLFDDPQLASDFELFDLTLQCCRCSPQEFSLREFIPLIDFQRFTRDQKRIAEENGVPRRLISNALACSPLLEPFASHVETHFFEADQNHWKLYYEDFDICDDAQSIRNEHKMRESFQSVQVVRQYVSEQNSHLTLSQENRTFQHLLDALKRFPSTMLVMRHAREVVVFVFHKQFQLEKEQGAEHLISYYYLPVDEKHIYPRGLLIDSKNKGQWMVDVLPERIQIYNGNIANSFLWLRNTLHTSINLNQYDRELLRRRGKLNKTLPRDVQIFIKHSSEMPYEYALDELWWVNNDNLDPIWDYVSRQTRGIAFVSNQQEEARGRLRDLSEDDFVRQCRSFFLTHEAIEYAEQHGKDVGWYADFLVCNPTPVTDCLIGVVNGSEPKTIHKDALERIVRQLSFHMDNKDFAQVIRWLHHRERLRSKSLVLSIAISLLLRSDKLMITSKRSTKSFYRAFLKKLYATPAQHGDALCLSTVKDYLLYIMRDSMSNSIMRDSMSDKLCALRTLCTDLKKYFLQEQRTDSSIATPLGCEFFFHYAYLVAREALEESVHDKLVEDVRLLLVDWEGTKMRVSTSHMKHRLRAKDILALWHPETRECFWAEVISERPFPLLCVDVNSLHHIEDLLSKPWKVQRMCGNLMFSRKMDALCRFVELKRKSSPLYLPLMRSFCVHLVESQVQCGRYLLHKSLFECILPFLDIDELIRQDKLLLNRTWFCAVMRRMNAMCTGAEEGILIPVKTRLPSILNESQQQAFLRCTSSAQRFRSLHLIQGPPGSGKTTLVAALVEHMLRCNTSNCETQRNTQVIPNYRILCVASTNEAVDNIAERLLTRGDHIEIARVGDLDKIRQSVRLYSLEEKRREFRKTNPKESKVQLKKWLDSCSVVCATMASAQQKDLSSLNFGSIIADEVSQSVIPEALIALSRPCERIILVGDPKQLPPTVLTDNAEGRNETPMETRRGEEPIRDTALYNIAPLTLSHSLFDALISVRISLLNVQYRMREPLARFSSVMFYNNCLYTHKSAQDQHLLKGFEFNPTGLFLIHYDNSEAEMRDASNSFYNQNEVRLVSKLLKLIWSKNPDLDPRQVATITPYSAQRKQLLSMLNQEHKFASSSNSPIDCSTVDAFQGREKEVIIVSLVRTKGSIGFLSDNRRMNVLLTRAKRTLFVVGHLGNLITNGSDEWRQWLEWKDFVCRKTEEELDVEQNERASAKKRDERFQRERKEDMRARNKSSVYRGRRGNNRGRARNRKVNTK